MQYPERRRWRRLRSIGEHGILRVQIRPGLDVVLLDISARGAHVETRHRLPPGVSVDVLLAGHSDTTVVRGQVLRCGVVYLDRLGVSYRGAIAFERTAFWPAWVGHGSGVTGESVSGRDASHE